MLHTSTFSKRENEIWPFSLILKHFRKEYVSAPYTVWLMVVLHSLLNKPWRLFRAEIGVSSFCIGISKCQICFNKEKTMEQQWWIERDTRCWGLKKLNALWPKLVKLRRVRTVCMLFKELCRWHIHTFKKFHFWRDGSPNLQKISRC